jgi:hypothetical protein
MSSNSTKLTTVAANSGSVTTMAPVKGGSFFSGKIGIIIASVISLGMFIGSFVSASQFLGSKDDWNTIKPQITKIWILTLVGTFGFMIAALLFFIQDSAKAMYFMVVISCLSLGLSYSALAVAAISR